MPPKNPVCTVRNTNELCYDDDDDLRDPLIAARNGEQKQGVMKKKYTYLQKMVLSSS